MPHFFFVFLKAAEVVKKSSVKNSVVLEDGKNQSLGKKVNHSKYE